MTIKVQQGIKALIFDLDGTLSDSLPVHLATWNIVGKKYGFVFDPKILIEMTGRPTIEFAERVVEQYGLSADPNEIMLLKQTSFWDMAHLLEPIDEVVSIVKANYGKLPMSVGTGAGRKSTQVQLKTLNLLKYFDAIMRRHL